MSYAPDRKCKVWDGGWQLFFCLKGSQKKSGLPTQDLPLRNPECHSLQKPISAVKIDKLKIKVDAEAVRADEVAFERD